MNQNFKKKIYNKIKECRSKNKMIKQKPKSKVKLLEDIQIENRYEIFGFINKKQAKKSVISKSKSLSIYIKNVTWFFTWNYIGITKYY